MTTSVSIANPWLHVAAVMAVPAYVLFFWSKARLEQPVDQLNKRSGAKAGLFLVWRLRWQLIFGAVTLAGAVLLVVGTHRLFVGVKADANGLTLAYPWPRSNVQLSWADVSKAAVDSKQFGTWRARRFCLRVVAGDSVFQSPWTVSAKEVNQACDLIQEQIGNRKVPPPAN